MDPAALRRPRQFPSSPAIRRIRGRFFRRSRMAIRDVLACDGKLLVKSHCFRARLPDAFHLPRPIESSSAIGRSDETGQGIVTKPRERRQSRIAHPAVFAGGDPVRSPKWSERSSPVRLGFTPARHRGRDGRRCGEQEHAAWVSEPPTLHAALRSTPLTHYDNVAVTIISSRAIARLHAHHWETRRYSRLRAPDDTTAVEGLSLAISIICTMRPATRSAHCSRTSPRWSAGIST